ncbi:MAG: amidohydrolase [Haloferacaceae archaeon]
MLELEHEFRALDCNARLAPGAERAERGGPEDLERELHQAGVVRAAVAPFPRGAPIRDGDAGGDGPGYLRDNNAVARLSVERPFLALARLNGPRDPRDTPAARLRNLTASRADHHATPEDVEQFGYDDRFHGFLLAPARDGLPDAATLDAIAETGLPALVRAGRGFPPASAAAAVLDRGVRTALLGFGGYPLDRELMGEALGLLDEYDDCYLETGYARHRDLLERGLREHPDRVVFGSGAPRSHPNVGVMELLTLDVPADAMRRAFTHNPARLLPALDD